MRRILAFLLVLMIVLALSLPALADDPLPYADIEGHWGLQYIKQVTESGLMRGDTDTTFSPDEGMTRGMFVTVLGRFAKINPKAWKIDYGAGIQLFTDVPSDRYYSPYINWAARNGIAQGVGDGRFEPDSLVTREQMMVMLKRFADVTGQTFQEVSILGAEGAENLPFSDAEEISGWARKSVEQLRNSGVIQGISNRDGTYRFDPKANATRAQAATVFCRMQGIVAPKPGWKENYVTLIMLNQSTARLIKDETVTLKAQFFPANATNKAVTWITSNPNVAIVDQGEVKWVGLGSCTIWAYSANGCKASCSVICEKYHLSTSYGEADPDVSVIPQDTSLAYGGESYAQKCSRIFGGYTNDPRAVYGSDAEASANMVSITVPTWDIGSDGQKYTREFTLIVHRNIAATVDQIFREIYACPAQYPIHSLGGYRYESQSEHNCGLAIDISPNENYYCYPDGTAIVGSFFSPETSEYSIPVGGEIDQIFSKYGFTRGIFWNSGYKDYMHYSFFGT